LINQIKTGEKNMRGQNLLNPLAGSFISLILSITACSVTADAPTPAVTAQRANLLQL